MSIPFYAYYSTTFPGRFFFLPNHFLDVLCKEKQISAPFIKALHIKKKCDSGSVRKNAKYVCQMTTDFAPKCLLEGGMGVGDIPGANRFLSVREV